LQDGQARIFCKRRISCRALAQTKYRTALGLNFSCMGAVGAQTGKRLPKLRSMVARSFHTFRIQPRAFKSAENESLQENRQQDLIQFCAANESATTFFKTDNDSTRERSGQPAHVGRAFERFHEFNDRLRLLRRPFGEFGVASEFVGHFLIGHGIFRTSFRRFGAA
jgi:hypothetical protein